MIWFMVLCMYHFYNSSNSQFCIIMTFAISTVFSLILRLFVYICRCNPIHRCNWSSTSRTSYHCWWPLSYDCRYCIVSFRNGKYCISSKRQLTIASTSCTVVFIVYVTFIWRLHCHYDIPFSDNRMQEMITAWGMHETIDPLAIDLIQQILRPNPNER